MSKGYKKNITNRRKPKNPQKENLEKVDGRDTFQTPNYATDIIVPFLKELVPMTPWKDFVVWECAAGLGKMAKRLSEYEFNVVSTDIAYEDSFNLLSSTPSFKFSCIVTNTPFSLKRRFFFKCVDYGVPFALLLPADYSGWIIEAVSKFGCEKIIPTRRIDYITPNILNRIHEGEIWEGTGRTYVDYTLEKFKEEKPDLWSRVLETNKHFCNYKSIYDAPKNLLRKYSSSYFHSMWLTWGFGIGKTETFAELTNEQKNNI